jgi:predicted PurR-regulated permease PerM
MDSGVFQRQLFSWLPFAAGFAIAYLLTPFTDRLERLAGQFFEGNVLSPKLVGESVGLHPVWLIFAPLAFGYLFASGLTA